MKKSLIISALFIQFLVSSLYAVPLNSWKQLGDKHKIGIYFGTFDPFTLGHQQIVERAIKEGCDAVLIMPSISSSQKKPTNLKVRVDLIHAAFATNEKVFYPYEGLVFETYFTNPGSTKLLFNEFTASDVEVVALMGADTINSELSLFKLEAGGYNPSTYLIFGRDGEEIKESNINLLKNFSNQVKIIRTQFEDVSSSKVRELLLKNYEIYFKKDLQEIKYRELFQKSLNKKVYEAIINRGIFIGYPASNRISLYDRTKDRVLQILPNSFKEYLLGQSRKKFVPDEELQPVNFEVLLDQKKVSLKVLKRLGNGFFSNAYLVELLNNGKLEKLVLKVSHQGKNFVDNMVEAYLSGKWLKTNKSKFKKLQFEIPTIYSFYADPNGENSYMLVEFIEGKTMNRFLNQSGVAGKAKTFAKTMFEASKELELHNGMILDSNAGNVLVGNNGLLYLIDTGLLPKHVSPEITANALYESWVSAKDK